MVLNLVVVRRRIEMTDAVFIVTLILSFICSLYTVNYIAKRISLKIKIILVILAIIICNPLFKALSEVSKYAFIIPFGFYLALGIYIIPSIKEFFHSSSNSVTHTESNENLREFLDELQLENLQREYDEINKKIERLKDEMLKYPTSGSFFGFGEGLSASEQRYNERKCDEIIWRIRDFENKRRNIEDTARYLGGSVTDNR